MILIGIGCCGEVRIGLLHVCSENLAFFRKLLIDCHGSHPSHPSMRTTMLAVGTYFLHLAANASFDGKYALVELFVRWALRLYGLAMNRVLLSVRGALRVRKPSIR